METLTLDVAQASGATPMLTSAKARELLHPNWAVAPEELPRETPPARYDLRSGFSDTVAWYRSAAWMKH